jgi:DHA2 family multidrug resistance protein
MADTSAMVKLSHKSASRLPSLQVPLKSWIAVIGSVVGAFMAILDVSITNSSLQDIEGHWEPLWMRGLGFPPPIW